MRKPRINVPVWAVYAWMPVWAICFTIGWLLGMIFYTFLVGWRRGSAAIDSIENALYGPSGNG